MTHEGETRINYEDARAFMATLDIKGFDPAMRVLDLSLELNTEHPLVVTLSDGDGIEIDFLTNRLPNNMFRFLLGY